MQISYRTYNSYHWSSISLSQHNQREQRKIHNAIGEVSKGDCIIMGDFNHGNIKWDTGVEIALIRLSGLSKKLSGQVDRPAEVIRRTSR